LAQVKTIAQPTLSDKKADQGSGLIVANVGNTNLRVVGLEGERIAWEARVPTDQAAEGPLPELPAGWPIAIVSVVPAVAEALARRWADRAPRLIRAGGVPGFASALVPPEGIGADRYCNALALRALLGWGLAVDCGTATTLTVVDRAGVLRGGAIMPGLGTMRMSLHRGTAQLPEVPLAVPEGPWGDRTEQAIQHGLVHGHAGAIAHLVARMRASLGAQAPVVLTGGWSGLLAPLLPGDFRHEPDWTITGARLAWEASAGHGPVEPLA
jgi:type III pantothenate kinase